MLSSGCAGGCTSLSAMAASGCASSWALGAGGCASLSALGACGCELLSPFSSAGCTLLQAVAAGGNTSMSASDAGGWATLDETVGAVVEMLGKRKGEMRNLREMSDGTTQLTYVIPTRGLLGFRHHFLTATRGMGILNSLFAGYDTLAGHIHSRNKDSLVAYESGVSNTYGLKNAETRGILFVGPGIDIYHGMVVGEHQRPGDLEVNVCKTKALNNMRTSFKEIDNRLTPPRVMSLDECIEYLAEDELLEVTPNNLRIRKRLLNHNDRQKAAKKAKQQS